MKIFLFSVLWAISLVSFSAPVSYNLTLFVEDSGTFWGEASVTIPLAPEQTALTFRLYPNHFGQFVRLEEARFFETSLPWDSVDPTVVVVSLPPDPPQTFSVRLKFSGTLPKALLGYGIFARTPSAVTLSQFYPILAPGDKSLLYPTFSFGDTLVAEVGDYTLHLVLPRGWIPVSSGEEEEWGPGLWRIWGENLRELGLVLVSGYSVVEEEWAELRIRAFAPPQLYSAAAQALAVAKEALDLFTARLGPFPYSSLDMVIVPLAGAGGVEFPGLILIAQNYALDYTSDFFAEIVAHELAHQWWYGEVGTDQVGEPWLDEGLATFASALLFENQGKLEEKVAGWSARYARAQSVNPKATVASPLWEFPSGLGYSGYVYAGSALFFAELRRMFGDHEFFGALRAFREKFRWRLARGCDLLQILAEVDGEALWVLAEKYLGKDYQCSGEEKIRDRGPEPLSSAGHP